jgi:hypothetical protein
MHTSFETDSGVMELMCYTEGETDSGRGGKV